MSIRWIMSGMLLVTGMWIVVAIDSTPAPKSTLPIEPPSGFGRTNPDVTQANIEQTICAKGWTAKIRPSTSYTGTLKMKLIKAAGLPDTSASQIELDHFIPLELGGAPKDPNNLWLEPWDSTEPDLGAHAKDKVENYLKRQVCDGKMTLAEAQKEITTNWVAIYQSI